MHANSIYSITMPIYCMYVCMFHTQWRTTVSRAWTENEWNANLAWKGIKLWTSFLLLAVIFKMHIRTYVRTYEDSCVLNPHPQPHPNAAITSTSPVVQHHLCKGPRFWVAWHCRAAGKDEVVAPEELVHRGNRRHCNVLLSTEWGLVTVRQWKTEQKRQEEWQRMQEVEIRHVCVLPAAHVCTLF